MENIFKIMKDFGIEMPEDKKADFEKSVLENYKTVNDYNKQVESLNKANKTIKANDDAMKDLQTKLDAFKDVDVTKLNKTIEDLKAEKARIENDYKDKEAKRDFDDLIKDAITGAHGKNAKAITALLDTLKENTYINNEGYISQVGFVTSNPIPVNANDIVKLTATGYLTNIVVINMCDENGNLSLASDDRRWSIDSTHTLGLQQQPRLQAEIQIRVRTTSGEALASTS